METLDREKSPTRRSGLLLLPLLILAALLAAPSTRGLLLTQLRMRHNAAPFASSPVVNALDATAAKSEILPFVSAKEQQRIAAIVARFPNDYAVQLGGALSAASRMPGSGTSTPQENYAAFQREYGVRLAAVQARFPNRPGPYAHLLREMTLNTVRVSRDSEVEIFETGKRSFSVSDSQIGYADSWAAFDRAAAQGEQRDPDNAYFPLMRAIGLFDAKRDAEGIAAVLRAGQKTRFEDYSLEESDAEWTLSLHAYGPSSMLVRQSIYSAVLLRHFAALRALGRLTAYKAAQAEREGRTQEGLALRHAMMQCASRMRAQGSVLAALVGIAIVSIQTNRPGGVAVARPAADLTSEQRADGRRDRYLAYLHSIGADEEARWFAQLDAENRRARALVQTAAENNLIDDATRPLPSLWMLDMLLLNNMLAMLILCAAGAGFGRLPGGRKRLLTLVIALAALCLLVALQMQWAEALTQVRAALDHLTLLSWDGGQKPGAFDMAGLVEKFPWMVHLGEVVFSLLAPATALLGMGILSAMRREKFTVALARGLQGGALIFATLLTVAYAAVLITTVHAEARFGSVLDGLKRNGIVYLQSQAESTRKP